MDSVFEIDDDLIGTYTTTKVIQLTFEVVGSFFGILFGVYLLVRPHFPQTYNFINSSDEYRTPLATESYGRISWIWKIFHVSDEDIYTYCGMDAIVFLRFLRFGMKVSAVGIFNSAFLIPVNIYGCPRDEGDNACRIVTDSLEKAGIGHLAMDSLKLLAPVVSAYILFGSAIRWIVKEHTWFTQKRHKFLGEQRADNYSIYVAHIPLEYRNEEALKEYFRSIFSHEDVIDAKIAFDVPKLEREHQRRTEVVKLLEHAINVKNVKGDEPWHITFTGEKVNSIPTYTNELEELNESIGETISRIEDLKKDEKRKFKEITEGKKMRRDLERIKSRRKLDIPDESPDDNLHDENEQQALKSHQVYSAHPSEYLESLDSFHRKIQDDMVRTTRQAKSKMKKTYRTVIESVDMAKNMTVDGVKLITKTLASDDYSIGTKAMYHVFETIKGTDDGQIREGGFVSFSSLSTKMQTLQMIHHDETNSLVVSEAPLPKHVYWDNVGLTHHEIQLGKFLALGLTTVFCIFATIPIAFVSSLQGFEQIQELPGFGFMNIPEWALSSLVILKPLILVWFMKQAERILTVICKFEASIDVLSLQASVFTKLSAFLIIQAFFVQAISGSILTEISVLMKDLDSIFNLLATTVPQQVKSFIQYILVQVFYFCGTEILRINPLISALIHRCFASKLTEKERQQEWRGYPPLSKERELEYSTCLADIMVNFMVLFVYANIAPIMSYFSLFSFLLLSMTYRNQIIYIYCKENDSGGKLWEVTVKILFSCMIIAEITIVAIMVAKNSVLAAGLLSPLLVITVLFAYHFSNRHYKMARYLPSTKCKEEDIRNNTRLVDYSWLKLKYLQPVLAKKTVYPDNFPPEHNIVTEASLPHDKIDEEEKENDSEDDYQTPTNSTRIFTDNNRSEYPYYATPQSCLAVNEKEVDLSTQNKKHTNFHPIVPRKEGTFQLEIENQENEDEYQTPTNSITLQTKLSETRSDQSYYGTPMGSLVADEPEIDLSASVPTVNFHPIVPKKEDNERSIFQQLNKQINLDIGNELDIN